MKKFIKTKEDFKCENCGEKVNGNGYTNHCPHCLYSKHVDINPGDRSNDCGGLMKPICIEKDGKEYTVTHSCLKCAYKKRNKISPKDNFDQVIKISKMD